MTLQNDDLFLVNRSGQSFKTEYGVLKENINEDQGVTISEDPPADPGEGDLWYNSEDGRLYVWYVNETTGIVTSVSTRNGGSGYTTQATNVETAGGTGFGLTVDLDPGVGGNFANPQVNNGGHGYTVGDYIIVTGAGHQNGTLNVTAINTASVGQWVDASPDGGDVGGGESLWQRDAGTTTLSPTTDGDDVDLGTGDLSAAAGTFSGNVDIGGAVGNGPGIATRNFGLLSIRRDTASPTDVFSIFEGGNATADRSFYIRTDGQVEIGPGDSPNITLAENGNADFAGTLWCRNSGRFTRTIETGFALGVLLDNKWRSLFLANGTLKCGTNDSGQSPQIQLFATNGDISYKGSLIPSSDQSLKENIKDASSQWDDVKNIRLRKYTWIDSPEKGEMLGVIAQELEEVCPRLITEYEDGIKGFKLDALMMKMLGALQESATRIEALEAEVQQLKGGN